VNTMFLAMEARALASIRDAKGCAEILHRAEQMFERSDPDKDPTWISYFDALELAGEAAHCFRDLVGQRKPGCSPSRRSTRYERRHERERSSAW